MPTIKVSPRQLGAALMARGKQTSNAVRQGLVTAAQRGRTLLVEKSDQLGITDTGLYKNSWVAGGRPSVRRGFTRSGVVATLSNRTPYAGIIEMGARPHGMSMDGLLSIQAWAMRKLGATALEAQGIAIGVARKLRLHGQKGRFVVRDAIPELTRYAVLEVSKAIMRERWKRAAPIGKLEG